MINYITPDDIRRCSGHRVAIDVETTGLSWVRNYIIGVGVWCPDVDVYGYIITKTKEPSYETYKALKSLSRDTVVIMHNAKFDCHMMGISPDSWDLIIDTTDLVHIIDSRLPKNAEWVEERFLRTHTKKDYIIRHPYTKIWDWPDDDVAEYCINDCRIEYKFAEVLIPAVCDLDLWDLFLKDMEYLKLLWEVERKGILLDTKFTFDAVELQRKTLKHLEQILMDSVGYEFNWRSTQQLSKAIYADMGIPKPKNPFADKDGVDRSRFADAGKYKSTCTSSFLLTEKVHHPLGELIFAMRESDRLIKVLEGWFLVTDMNKVVHTNFNLTGTRTGRLSSSKPNIQNVPSEARGRFTQSIYTGDTHRTAEYNLRNAFIARPGTVMISTDFKQMEMRMFGILSQDPFMLKSLAAGRDIHGDIAEKVWGTRDEVHREWSKTISFGLIYGMTIGSLMYKLNMPRAEAARVCDQYWKEFPRIKPWLDDVVQECMATGAVHYWSGRLWKEEKQIDMYKGANAQIQGGCADLLSVAALRVRAWIREQNNPNIHILNLVHDEVIVESPIEICLYIARNVAKIMQVPDLFDIPFATDTKIGFTYGSLNKVPKELVADESIIRYDPPPIAPLEMGKDPEFIEIVLDEPEEESQIEEQVY